ncbi:MAG TPA: ester cyclase [Solirubrobacteraceae bacterium]|nr:ester cyclase [Solirubrobacteraceae bacterium]
MADAASPPASAAVALSPEQLARREALVREHMESENDHDFDTTLRTFGHARYELIATGETYDGEEQVSAYYAETRAAFPDQRNELIALHHTTDSTIAEFWLLGTHLGPLRGLLPTGRSFRCQMTALFLFEDERLVCERVYFDQSTILRQLGLARDPRSLLGRLSLVLNHPLTIVRAALGARRGKRR